MYLNTFAFSFDILLFCETWLRDSECGLFSIPGYTGHFVCRQDRIGGGVAIYIKSNFKIKLLPDSNSTSLYNNASVSVESLFIEVLDVCKCSFIVGCVYNPPNNCNDIFSNYLCCILHKIKDRKVCFGGGI